MVGKTGEPRLSRSSTCPHAQGILTTGAAFLNYQENRPTCQANSKNLHRRKIYISTSALTSMRMGLNWCQPTGAGHKHRLHYVWVLTDANYEKRCPNRKSRKYQKISKKLKNKNKKTQKKDIFKWNTEQIIYYFQDFRNI